MTRAPRVSDSAACSASFLHATQVMNVVSPSFHWLTLSWQRGVDAIRKFATGVLARLNRSCGFFCEVASDCHAALEDWPAAKPDGRRVDRPGAEPGPEGTSTCRPTTRYVRYYSPYTPEEVTERDVDLIQLLPHKGRTYLYGWCRLREAERYFRLDRILELAELDVTASPRPRPKTSTTTAAGSGPHTATRAWNSRCPTAGGLSTRLSWL